jgi:hypothetical protein
MSVEFGLAVDCCRWVNEPERATGIAEAAAAIDWHAFLSMVERHRVAGLAWNALHSLHIPLPAEIASNLSAQANEIAAHGLRAAVQSAAISATLDRAAIPHLFVKGLPVGMLAYSSPFIKHSWDIDLLVDETQIEAAAAVLQSLDYSLAFPDFDVDWPRLARWHRTQKDSAWRDRESGLVVELHSRLADNELLIPTVGISSPRQLVALGNGIMLPTLAWPEMFAHLCVHGASSAWFRLKWISDLAALLARASDRLDDLFERSQQLGAGRAVGQALLLAHRLFGLGVDQRLLQSLEASAANRWLAETAMRQLLADEPSGRPFGTAAIHASQLFLLPGLRFKAAELRRQTAAAMSNLLD